LEPPHVPTPPPVAPIVYARPVSLRVPRRFDFFPRTRGEILFDLLLVLAFGFMLPTVGQIVYFALVAPDLDAMPTVTELATSKYCEALIVLVLAWGLCKFRKYDPAALGARTDRLGQQVLWSVPTLIGIYLAMIITIVPIAWLVMQSEAAERDLANRMEFIEMLPVFDPWMAAFLMIAVAIHEELLFRGLMIPFLRYLGLPWWLAICGPCAVFAILHVSQGVIGIVQVFFVGLALSLFFVWTRSLLAVMLAHFMFNFLQLQFVRLMSHLVEELGEAAPAV
jgi:membrane protease YdiL (CAAX protease family)